MQQKIFQVYNDDTLFQLNQELAKGWRVVFAVAQAVASGSQYTQKGVVFFVLQLGN